MNWPSVLLAALSVIVCCQAHHLHLAILPDPEAQGQAATKTGRHDLYAIADSLKKLGHAVSIIEKVAEESIYDLLANKTASKEAMFNAILAQGEPHLRCLWLPCVIASIYRWGIAALCVRHRKGGHAHFFILIFCTLAY